MTSENRIQPRLGHRTQRIINIISTAVFFIWIAAQILINIHYLDATQYSDAGIYQRLASECYLADTWYPTATQLTAEPYVFNPGYVNFLILCLHIFGTFGAVPWLNIVFNVIIAFCVTYFTTKFLGTVHGRLALIMYCLLWSNIMIAAPTMSEILFGVLTYASIAAATAGSNGKSGRDILFLILSGILIAYANFVRPVALLFFVPTLLYLAIVKGSRIRRIGLYLAGGAAMSVLIIAFNFRLNGHPIVAASTSGVNLIMGANDKADGSYTGETFNKGGAGDLTEYEGELNVFTRDSIWMARSIEWIKANPGRYAGLMPVKLMRLWLGDDYQDINFDTGHKKHINENRKERIIEIASRSTIYYLILLLAVAGVIIARRRLWSVIGLWLLPIAGACAIHMLMYGGMRYHYPYMPLVIFYATIGLYAILTQIDKKTINDEGHTSASAL